MSKRAYLNGEISLEKPSLRREADFLDAVRRSVRLHGRWVQPPRTSEDYRGLLKRARAANRFAHFLCGPERCLVGVVNINEVVRGAFDSGYLGFYAFAPYAGRGYMRSGISVVITRAFADYGLHRLEANVQPENIRSRALVQSLGFRLEGYSPRYLRIAGKWRDHERWAIAREDWKVDKRKS